MRIDIRWGRDGFLGFGCSQAIDVWLLQAIGDWLVLTRFRWLISPTAGGFALWFFALISHVWGRDARNMARCGGRGGRGDYTD